MRLCSDDFALTRRRSPICCCRNTTSPPPSTCTSVRSFPYSLIICLSSSKEALQGHGHCFAFSQCMVMLRRAGDADWAKAHEFKPSRTLAEFLKRARPTIQCCGCAKSLDEKRVRIMLFVYVWSLHLRRFAMLSLSLSLSLARSLSYPAAPLSCVRHHPLLWLHHEAQPFRRRCPAPQARRHRPWQLRRVRAGVQRLRSCLTGGPGCHCVAWVTE